MKTKNFRTSLLIILTSVTAILLVTACGQIEANRNYVVTSLPGLIRASFQTFDLEESQPVGMQAGQTIDIQYKAELTKGQVIFQLLDPDGEVVWEKSVGEDISEQVTLNAEKTGRYRVNVVGEKAGGSYEITWEVK
jgi:hypothetical protein